MTGSLISESTGVAECKAVTERPILFSAPMVSAIISGRKTQTRRAVKAQADSIEPHDGYPGEWSPWKDGERQASILCPYGAPGERLWVRETFWVDASTKEFKWYVNDVFTPDRERDHCKLRPGIFMPRDTSRILLEITDVRAQLLQETTRLDIAAEGWPMNDTQEGQVACVRDGLFDDDYIDDAAIEWYADLWDAINGKGAWDANPWIWALTFKKVDWVSRKAA